jgi:hypothetical protein
MPGVLRGAGEVNVEVVGPPRRRSEEGAQEVGDVMAVLGALMARYGEAYDGRAMACTGADAAGFRPCLRRRRARAVVARVSGASAVAR